MMGKRFMNALANGESDILQELVLGYPLGVAPVADVLRGKSWAHLDTSRRPSKRQKDLADIMRLLEAQPALESQLPPDIRRALPE